MGNGVSRQGIDSAGGIISPATQSTVKANSAYINLPGAPVAGHGNGPHIAPVMVGHSNTVKIGGVGICRQGDSASCGHTSSGSSNVKAG